jgi:hypothetical protein
MRTAPVTGSPVAGRDSRPGFWVVALFTGTLSVSAALLFAVQPMFAKLVLPLLGGTPAVWNTCMVFFHAALLAGYAYAHVTFRVLGVRRQAAIHLGIVLTPLLLLPVTLPEASNHPSQDHPALWLLWLLLTTLGAPFFVVSATAPLVQTWFTRSNHRMALDPYFLYAASNTGSLAALLAYPTLIDVNLAHQSRLWSVSYVVLLLLLIACASVVWRHDASADPPLAFVARPLPTPGQDTVDGRFLQHL